MAKHLDIIRAFHLSFFERYFFNWLIFKRPHVLRYGLSRAVKRRLDGRSRAQCRGRA